MTHSSGHRAEDEPAEVPALTEKMIAELRELNAIRSEPVAKAFREVPRWRFAPGAPLNEVYAARDAVVTKRDAQGIAISSVSAPEIQAFMLEQAELEPGMRVLEIGSGGANAALISELVGLEGHVTTVDIDSEVTERAATLLKATGYDHVEVINGDASDSLPGGGPWDRIIVTVGAWDLPAGWTDRLAPDGRIVVPIRLRGITRSLALEVRGDHLEAVSTEVCGFVQMQGVGGHEERLFLLKGKEIGLRFDDDNVPEDLRVLDGAIGTERYVEWTGVVTRAGESFAELELLAAAALPNFCLLACGPGAARSAGLIAEDELQFRLAHVQNRAFAFLISKRLENGTFEFGVAGFGADAKEAADFMARLVRRWDELRPGRTEPAITVWPGEIPTAQLPEGFVIDKHHRKIVLSWPDRAVPAPSTSSV